MHETPPVSLDQGLLRRTLSVCVPALLLGLFWYSLPMVCPQWSKLLRHVELADQISSDGLPLSGNYSYKSEVFGGTEGLSYSDTIVLLLLLVVFYLVKTLIAHRVNPRIAALPWYVLLVSVSLPYLYLRIEDWGNPNVSLTGNWLGTPVMFFVVPTVSFVYDTIDREVKTLTLLIRNIAEIVILIPLWSYIWVIISYLFLGLMWG